MNAQMGLAKILHPDCSKNSKRNPFLIPWAAMSTTIWFLSSSPCCCGLHSWVFCLLVWRWWWCSVCACCPERLIWKRGGTKLQLQSMETKVVAKVVWSCGLHIVSSHSFLPQLPNLFSSSSSSSFTVQGRIVLSTVVFFPAALLAIFFPTSGNTCSSSKDLEEEI